MGRLRENVCVPFVPTIVGINLPTTYTAEKEIVHDLNITPALLTNFSTRVSQSH